LNKNKANEKSSYMEKKWRWEWNTEDASICAAENAFNRTAKTERNVWRTSAAGVNSSISTLVVEVVLWLARGREIKTRSISAPRESTSSLNGEKMVKCRETKMFG
jgi:hypothetical protein